MTDSFKKLVLLYENLCEHSLEKMDALEIQKIAQKKEIQIPVWFQGIGRGLKKIREKSKVLKKWMSSSELAEMASQREVSNYRFQMLSQYINSLEAFVFPTSGIGLDFFHFHNLFQENVDQKALYVSDINITTCKMLKHNLASHNIPAHVICHDVLDGVPIHFPIEKSYCFLDPARRMGGEKKYRIYFPPLKDSMKFLENFAVAQIKLAPGEKLDELNHIYPAWSWTVVQLEHELKEAYGIWVHPNFQKREESQQSAVYLSSGKTHCFSVATEMGDAFHGADITHDVQCEDKVYLAKKVLRHSGLVKIHAAELFLKRTNLHSSIYVSDENCVNPFWEPFKVLGMCSLKEKKMNVLLKKFTANYYELRKLDSQIKFDEKLLKQKITTEPKYSKLIFLIFKRGRSEQGILLKKFS